MKRGIKQLSATDRAQIEALLNMEMSHSQIANKLNRSVSTIKREIKKHTKMLLRQTSPNQCIYRQQCQKKCICKNCPTPALVCTRCTVVKCNLNCANFKRIICSKIAKQPAQICNSCQRVNTCTSSRFVYRAKTAHNEYTMLLHEKAKGFAISEEELIRMDEIISPRIKKGQAMHHIFQSLKGRFSCDERTAMRMMNAGLFTAKRGDLPRACMMRKRKKPTADYTFKIEKDCYANRTFEDYVSFMNANVGISPIMMDLVIGRIGGKCIMTLHSVSCCFMFGYLIPNKCADTICSIFDMLWETLGARMFRKLFPVILTDRGTEFSNPSRIEFAPDGSRRTYVFYCDPMNSNQKSQIERNHEQLRRILPKGTSFDNLEQDDINLAMSHINSYILASQQNRSPYEVFKFIYGKGMSAKLKIERIAPEDVVLNPALLEKIK